MNDTNRIREIALDNKVSNALASFESDLRETLDLTIAIQQIPAPTFQEEERATYVESLFTGSKLDHVHRDNLNNVFGRLPGKASQRPVVVSAHLDTVFAMDTDLTVKFKRPEEKNIRVFGPGIADNSLGVAGLITLARTLIAFDLKTESEIWLVANVCEEGLGDLRGMRTVVDKFGPDATYIVVEGGSFGLVFHEAIGVNRFLIEVKTPGGHSWGDFGKPNAIHILSQLVAEISDIDVPRVPKTSFNVGVIKGGTTINAIASEASCQLDLRSAEKDLLSELTDTVRSLVEQVNEKEYVDAEMTQIGRRPSGRLSRDTTVVSLAAQALEHVGCSSVDYMAGSTDASVPIGLGIPSVCIGLAKSGNTHRLDEFVDITHLSRGLGQLLLLTLATAGFSRA
ncbi:MAG TPA: M20/M25/M40 family metallo-hydrolase [candidate division Zixibacteria bacterium]|nr:M20/M25/M40 family metallo-hydrolase [candidate division Zixibacteria bacterium]